MPAGNIVYKSSSSSSPRVTKHTHNEPIYATVKKRLPKKGITRRGAVKRKGKGKGKPTKKINHTKSSNTVYAVLNLKSPKNPNKNTIKRSSRTPLKRIDSKGKLISTNNNGSPNRENVNKVMKQVRNATPLSKNEAQKKLNRAMESK